MTVMRILYYLSSWLSLIYIFVIITSDESDLRVDPRHKPINQFLCFTFSVLKHAIVPLLKMVRNKHAHFA